MSDHVREFVLIVGGCILTPVLLGVTFMTFALMLKLFVMFTHFLGLI